MALWRACSPRLPGNGGSRMLQVVFDDTLPVPEAVRALVGVDRFGHVVFRRRTRTETMQALVATAGWPPVIHLNDESDVAALIDGCARRLTTSSTCSVRLTSCRLTIMTALLRFFAKSSMRRVRCSCRQQASGCRTVARVHPAAGPACVVLAAPYRPDAAGEPHRGYPRLFRRCRARLS